MYGLTALAATAATSFFDYGSLLGGLGDEAKSGISAAMPIAIPLAGAIIGITLGVKLFKKFAK